MDVPTTTPVRFDWPSLLAARTLTAGMASRRFGPASVVYTRSYVRPLEDGLSPATLREFEDGPGFFERFEGRIVLEALAGLDVLDLGCGYGGRTLFYAAVGRARSMVGLEINPRMATLGRAAAARLASKSTVAFVGGRAERQPFDDGQFDLIVSYDVLEHVDDVAAALSECHRVLRPGGRLVALFPPYYGPRAHHLDFITTLPFLHHLFPARALVGAANRVIAATPALERRPFPDWPRGTPLPTLNGTTERRFRRVVDRSGFEVEELGLLPFGWGDGGPARQFVSSACRAMLRLPWPFTRDVFASSIRCVLRRPTR